MKRLTVTSVVFALVLLLRPAPAGAWVAAGGYHGGVVAVGYRPPCCYGGAAVAGAAIAGAAVGAAVASTAYASAAPVYYAAPVAYAPPVGTVVAALPDGCSSMSVNGISYMNCGGIWYQPFYSGGALLYRVSTP